MIVTVDHILTGMIIIGHIPNNGSVTGGHTPNGMIIMIIMIKL